MRILFVENHDIFARIVMEESLSTHEVVVVPSLEKARVALRTGRFDLALVDYDLDDGKGDTFVRESLAEFPEFLAIAVSSHERGNEALMAAGALAVCAKTDFKHIAAVIEQVWRRLGEQS